MYLIAAACLGNSQVVAVHFLGEGSLFVELGLDNYTGNMHIASGHRAPGGRHPSLAFAGLFNDWVARFIKTLPTRPGESMSSVTRRVFL